MCMVGVEGGDNSAGDRSGANLDSRGRESETGAGTTTAQEEGEKLRRSTADPKVTEDGFRRRSDLTGELLLLLMLPPVMAFAIALLPTIRPEAS